VLSHPKPFRWRDETPLAVSPLWFQAENTVRVLLVPPSLDGQHPHRRAADRQGGPRERSSRPLGLQTKHGRNVHARGKGHCRSRNPPALHTGRQDFITVYGPPCSTKPLPVQEGWERRDVVKVSVILVG